MKSGRASSSSRSLRRMRSNALKEETAMLKRLMLAGVSLLFLILPAQGKEPDSCRAPRIANGGWTDNTAQNALAMTVLRHLGYEPKDQLLSVPVILESLKNKQIDILLDNWMPSQTAEVRPYLDAKTIESHAVNLDGAGYGRWCRTVS